MNEQEAWLDPQLSSTERGRAYRRSKGEFVHIDALDRELSVHISRFHGPILSVHHDSKCAYVGDAAVELARYLLQDSGYEVRPIETTAPAPVADPVRTIQPTPLPRPGPSTQSEEGLIAFRSPRGGKAHRQLAAWGVTVCRDTGKGAAFFATLTERVPLSHVEPKNRCKTCWRNH